MCFQTQKNVFFQDINVIFEIGVIYIVQISPTSLLKMVTLIFDTVFGSRQSVKRYDLCILLLKHHRVIKQNELWLYPRISKIKFKSYSRKKQLKFYIKNFFTDIFQLLFFFLSKSMETGCSLFTIPKRNILLQLGN